MNYKNYTIADTVQYWVFIQNWFQIILDKSQKAYLHYIDLHEMSFWMHIKSYAKF
jgi:hypothetical protein